MTLDIDNTSAKDLIRMSENILTSFSNSEQLSSKALKMLDGAEKTLANAPVKKSSLVIGNKVGYKNFLTPVLAISGRKIDPQTWAENLSKQYDDLRGAQKNKQLAEQLNTDAKTAYSQMQLAAKIIQDASAVEEANAVSEAWTKSINILQVYKTTAKVSLFATSTLASGGGSLSALAASKVSLSAAGSLMIAGTDCLIDIGTTTSNIVLGENNKVTMQFEDLKDKYATFSFIAGLLSPSESFAGETIAFVRDSLADLFYDSKIIGIKLKADKDKKVMVTSQVIDISDLNEDQAKVEIEKAGFNLPAEASISLEQLIADYSREVQNIIKQVDDLVIELAKILKNDPIKESDKSIFGVYTLYTTSSL